MALLATAHGLAMATIPSSSSSSAGAGGARLLSFSRSETLAAAAGLSVSAAVPPLLSSSTLKSPVLEVYCGKGDKKTARGKRFNHSYGNARPRNKKKGRGPPRAYAPPAPPRKDKYDDGEIIEVEIDESILN